MSDPDDVTSDPSLDDGESADWSDEGGSTPDGPATDPEATETDTDAAQDPQA